MVREALLSQSIRKWASLPSKEMGRERCACKSAWTRVYAFSRAWNEHKPTVNACTIFTLWMRGRVGGSREGRRGQIRATQRNNQCSLRVITLRSSLRADCFKGVTRIERSKLRVTPPRSLPYYISSFGVVTRSNVWPWRWPEKKRKKDVTRSLSSGRHVG